MKRTPIKRKTPLKRGKPLARVSKKRRTLNALLNPGRVGFLLLVETCMVCRKEQACDCHEICRGAAREECLHHPRLWLACCRSCHELMDDYSKWPIEKQILLRLQWELEQTCKEANEVRGRAATAITPQDVLEHVV
jgi:hypothetical protein